MTKVMPAHASFLTRLNRPTLLRCREVVRKAHAEYFGSGDPPDWQIDALIEALGEVTVMKLLDNAELAGMGATKVGAGGNQVLAGGKAMRKLTLSSNIADALRGRDPDEAPSAVIPGRNI